MYKQVIKAGCFKSNSEEKKKKKKIETTEIELLVEVLSKFNSVFLFFLSRLFGSTLCVNETSCIENWTLWLKSNLLYLQGWLGEPTFKWTAEVLTLKEKQRRMQYSDHYRQLNGKSTITRACFKSYILNRKQPSRKKSLTAHRIIKVKLPYFSEPLFLPLWTSTSL